MKKILHTFILLPFLVFSQTEETYSIIDELYNQIEENNPPITKSFQEGWNMFGYPCQSENDVEQSFLSIVDNVILVKDNSGSAYLPEWDFNGIGNLVGGEGYQTKVSAPINNFNFCDGVILPSIEELDFSTETNSFYLGVLDSTQYSLMFFEMNEGYQVYVEIKILYPPELVNAKYIGDVDLERNGLPYNTSHNRVSSNHIKWRINNGSINYDGTNKIPNEGDVFDFHFITSVGIFTISEEYAALHPFINGCQDSLAQNYNPEANIDYLANNPINNSSCEILGCTDSQYFEYNENANVDDGSCINLIIACPYVEFLEYNPIATSYDEGLCNNLILEGCTDNTALNYNIQANLDDESCEFIYGCIDQDADNYNIEATTDDGSCIHYGCTDPIATNYNESANTDDESCLMGGCMNATAENYNVDAQIDDGSCIIYGCTVSIFPNYNSYATIGDGSCDINSTDVYGCLNDSSWVFGESATIDNGSCIFESPQIGDIVIGQGVVVSIDETGEHGLIMINPGLGLMNWYDAMNAVDSSTILGYNDWRLPEFTDISELGYYFEPFFDLIDIENDLYWSSQMDSEINSSYCFNPVSSIDMWFFLESILFNNYEIHRILYVRDF